MWNDLWYMKVIITYTFCCGNLWKSINMALEKPGKLGQFFSPTLRPPSECCWVALVSRTLRLNALSENGFVTALENNADCRRQNTRGIRIVNRNNSAVQFIKAANVRRQRSRTQTTPSKTTKQLANRHTDGRDQYTVNIRSSVCLSACPSPHSHEHYCT